MKEHIEYFNDCIKKIKIFQSKNDNIWDVYTFINDAIFKEMNYAYEVGLKETNLLFNLKQTQNKQLANCVEKHKKKKNIDKEFSILISNLLLDFSEELNFSNLQ